MRSQHDLQASLERQNAGLARFPADFDRPVSGNTGLLLDQPLNDAGGVQHGIDIVGQRRAAMVMAIDAVDGIAKVKSVKRHEIIMPRLRTTALTLINSADFCAAGTLAGHSAPVVHTFFRQGYSTKGVFGPALRAQRPDGLLDGAERTIRPQ